MAFSAIGVRLQEALKRKLISSCCPLPSNICVRYYAARPHTRAKRDKIAKEIRRKKALEEAKRATLEKLAPKIGKSGAKFSPKTVDLNAENPVDNVYVADTYKIQKYSLTDAVQFYSDYYHPSVTNRPKAPIEVAIELNMEAEKKNRFMDKFTRIAPIPFPFNYSVSRKVIVLTNNEEEQQKLKAQGADIVGGAELITSIKDGGINLPEYRFIISHPFLVAELMEIRLLLKNKFPTANNKTLGLDLAAMVHRCKYGLEYSCEINPADRSHGRIVTPIGTIDMGASALESNLINLIQDIHSVRPQTTSDFITWVWCTSSNCTLKFCINFEPYLGLKKNEDDAKQQQQQVKVTV